MTTESIIAIASTIINGAVMIGVWKLFSEYKNYNKETSWKNVKEHYDEIKIPNEVAKAEKKIVEDVEAQIAELNPMVDNLIRDHMEMVRFSVRALMYMDKETAFILANEHMPNSVQYFEKIWAWHDQQNASPRETP